MQGNIYQVDKEPLVNIPILRPDKQTEFLLSEYCDKIYRLRLRNRDADIFGIENEIDDIVYNAYGLTTQEIIEVKNVMKSWETTKKY